jgi:hypothetical protein
MEINSFKRKRLSWEETGHQNINAIASNATGKVSVPLGL